MLRLPEELRSSFDARLGKVLEGKDIRLRTVSELIPPGAVVVTVGDMCSATLLDMGIVPDLAVVDNSTRRGACGDFPAAIDSYTRRTGSTPLSRRQDIENPRERIGSALWKAVREGYSLAVANKKIYNDSPQPADLQRGTMYLIVVQGEEDLAIIPAILEAPADPTHTVIIYGIPGVGIDIFQPLEGIRETAREIVNRMEVEHGTPDLI